MLCILLYICLSINTSHRFLKMRIYNMYSQFGASLMVCVCAQLLQSCPTFHNSMDCSPPGSSVHGIFQARILEQIAMPSPPGDLPHPGIEHTFLMSPALAGRFFTTSDSWEALYIYIYMLFPIVCFFPSLWSYRAEKKKKKITAFIRYVHILSLQYV